MDTDGGCLSEAEKREAILQILNSPGDSASNIDRLKTIDPNWFRVVNGGKEDAKKEVPIQIIQPKEKAERPMRPPIAVKPKPKTPPTIASGKQVPVGTGTITRLSKSIGETGQEEELRNHKCPDDLHSACLNEADRRNWPGFSCANCSNFRS